MDNFDIIIIGAGGIGSAAAYYLAKAQQRVLILEQFELNHQLGSSYGYSRVIRYAYNNPIYINLMRQAYTLWFALQEEAQETLYIKTGELDFGQLETPSLQQLVGSMEEAKIPYKRLTYAEIKQRFPQFNVSEGIEGVYQEDTGILKASQCVLTHLKLAKNNGLIVKENSPVTNIKNESNTVTVTTPHGSYNAAKVIVTTGSWTKDILMKTGIELPLTIMPCQLAFFRVNHPEQFKPGKFPIFLGHFTGDYGEFPYGLPSCDHQGVKISTFYGWDKVQNINQIDYTPSLDWIEKVRVFLNQYLPDANGELIETRRCLYTMTPDKDFIVDHHPENSNILIATGFSGHGFKFTTLIGKILTDLIVKNKTDCDLSLFQINRFS